MTGAASPRPARQPRRAARAARPSDVAARRRILLTGADSLVGARVLRGLLEASMEVVALAASRTDEDIPPGVIRVVANRTGTQWTDWAAGCSAAVHVGPGLGERPADDGGCFGVGPADTNALLAACQRHGIPRVVLVSCLGASPAAASARQRAAGAAEETLRAAGLAITVLRPAWLAAPGPSLVARVLHAVRAGRLVALYGGGAFPLQTIAADDVAGAVVRCLHDDSTCGRVFELVAGDPIPFVELARRLAAAAQQRLRTLAIPRRLALPLASLLRRRPGTVMTPDEILALWARNTGDAAAARAHFGALSGGLDLVPRAGA